jgi:tRNA pseudouridine38-40 synthase
MVGSTAFQCEPPVWAPLSLRARWPFRSSQSVFRLIPLACFQRLGHHYTRKAEYIPLPVALQPPSPSGNLFSNGPNLNDSAQCDAFMQTWKLTLAYDGTDFSGWQIQPRKSTVQGELQAALGRVTGEAPLPQGSGRTDAGVHALGQVASFPLQANIPPDNLQRALNRTLPQSIRIIESRTVQSTFHGRHSAIAKTYEYRVFREPICPPFLARYVHPCAWPMDFEALQASARLFEGQHDFLSFAATDPDQTTRNPDSSRENGQNSAPAQPSARQTGKEGSIRTIYSSNWEPRQSENGDLLVYRVRGNGFLHHMVRNLVGTMLDVGRGHLNAEKIPAILAARSRSAAGPTAPAQGLFLHSVEYDEAKFALKSESLESE